MFVEHFEILVIPVHSELCTPIPDLVQQEVDRSSHLLLLELLPPGISKHVYYVTGFLSHAGAKKAKHLSMSNDVGACISTFGDHFASSKDEYFEQTIELMPSDVLELVKK